MSAFSELQEQIEQAKKEGRSTAPYIRQQIALLQNAHDEFIQKAQAEGYRLNDVRVGEIRVKQYAAMRQLAEEIGDPTEQYDERIKEIQTGVFGDENYKRFFGNKD